MFRYGRGWRRSSQMILPLFVLFSTILPNTVDADGQVASRIQTWLDPYVQAGHFSGCVLVAQGDAAVYEACFGEANRELGIANSPQTRFAIASVTKPLQLVLLARLVEEGALTLNDSIARWLPDFPRATEIKVVHLANHTAGVPHRLTSDTEEATPRTAADMVELVKAQGLLGEPGGERVYSSGGFSVLARVLELAGGDTWSALMERYVFAPAAMSSTVHPDNGRLIPNRASSYRWSVDGLRNTAPKDLSFLVGAGSLYSTPRDLRRAVQAVVSGTYGTTAQTFVVREREQFGWNGVTAGYRAFVDYDAEARTTIVVCANIVTGVLNRLRDNLPQLIAGQPATTDPVPRVQFRPMQDADLATYNGRYQLRPGSILNVRARAGAVYANDWLLLPLGEDRFFSIQDYNYLTFVRDVSDVIVRIDWGDGDSPYELPRLGDLE